MKKISLLIILGCIVFICSSHGGKPLQPWEKENVSFPMLNAEIRHSMEENERQKDLKDEQTQTTTLETTNRKKWQSYKETVTKIQDRLRIVSFSLQMIPTGYQISLYAKQIKENQIALYKELEDAPYALVVALPAQYQFIDDFQMTLRLLTGIVISYGAINQMEKAERQRLLNYALDEVVKIKNQSFDILWIVRNLKQTVYTKKHLFKYYVNRDKQIKQDIFNNVKSFKNL